MASWAGLSLPWSVRKYPYSGGHCKQGRTIPIMVSEETLLVVLPWRSSVDVASRAGLSPSWSVRKYPYRGGRHKQGRTIPTMVSVFRDEALSMDVHIKHLCHILICQLCRLGKIRPFLSTDAANKLAVSFILTRLDYCNSLHAGLPDNKLNKLQSIQNHAARVVL